MAKDNLLSPLEFSNSSPMSGRDRPLTSPRLQHFDGEVPPALSPLDAFAAQGRLLAKHFDDSKKAGRRLSRIPHSSVERSLSRPRTGYSRKHSNDDNRKYPGSPSFVDYNAADVGLGLQEPKFRPQSQHPRLSGFPQDANGFEKMPWNNSGSSSNGGPQVPGGGFGAPRAESPEEEASWLRSQGVNNNKPEGLQLPRQHSSGDSSNKFFTNRTNLAPPSMPRANSSPGSFQPESSDDDYYTSSTTGSTFSKPRKLSSGSVVSLPHTPFNHPNRPQPRSPSPNSEQSSATTPHNLPKPSFNFSRPLSRSSTSLSFHSPNIPSPKPVDEAKSRFMNRENKPAPITLPDMLTPESQNVEEPLQSAGHSYIYAKYSLPRGRRMSRNSLVFSPLQTPHFQWNEPLFESTPPPSAFRETFARTPSPPPPTTIPFKKRPSESPKPIEKPSPAKSSPDKTTTTKRSDGQASASVRHSFEQGSREAISLPHRAATEKRTVRPVDNDAKSSSSRSQSTIRPQTSQHADAMPKSQMTAEDHVTKGIACHENGSLNESTYHLRLAAMQNHPTGMLLYALACRHGWGMRTNPTEGVKWLRKAVDSAGLDLTNGTAATIEPRGRSMAEQKTRQAQFALSIYELGVSHMNGWGIDQDKGLALRCFEIAAEWGDVDALAEAGYCYAEGSGCKKDLKKAAKYYRMAESKGMSMVGNSWIYKDKYMSEDEAVPPTTSLKSTSGSEKKPRSKSRPRARSIFGRKKSTATNTQ
ncbi:hypothetical protein FQN57_001918 [Myotisia sp. PD_48]|nr:hypothetical protein FQN57_001918 [Myotisia sp. PD_48]